MNTHAVITVDRFLRMQIAIEGMPAATLELGRLGAQDLADLVLGATQAKNLASRPSVTIAARVIGIEGMGPSRALPIVRIDQKLKTIVYLDGKGTAR